MSRHYPHIASLQKCIKANCCAREWSNFPFLSNSTTSSYSMLLFVVAITRTRSLQEIPLHGIDNDDAVQILTSVLFAMCNYYP
jgi:hypothetical protein